MSAIPTVSIGLPVFNGERYLAEALDTLLSQDYQDFELIISDNASVDRTAEICRDYAGRDRRIRYFRHEKNIGLHPNFNRPLELARGPLFRWAADDDLVARDYLGSCVALLQSTPDAVLCQSHARIIGAHGEELGTYDGGLAGAESPDVAERFAALILTRHLCTHIFGVIRTDALRRIRGLGDYYGSDRAALAALGLLGRFVQVPRLLFLNREHPGRFSRATDHAQEWRDASVEPTARNGPRTWELFADYQRAVRDLVDSEADRRRCRLHLARWWAVDWNAARLAVDVVGGRLPGVYDLVGQLKLRLYGPMPQIGLRCLPRVAVPDDRAGLPPGRDAPPASGANCPESAAGQRLT